MRAIVDVVVDTREPEAMLALLRQRGLRVERAFITPGDYVVSSNCAVERKIIHDFVESLFKGRLWDQVQRLKESYEKPVLLLDGDMQLELQGRRNPRAFWGALLRIELDMLVTTLVTCDMSQSADAIYILAKRLQSPGAGRISRVYKPKALTQRDLQTSIVASLPNIGEELAKRLLTNFGSVRAVFKASRKALTGVEGVGQIRAERISKILDAGFQSVEDKAEAGGLLQQRLSEAS